MEKCCINLGFSYRVSCCILYIFKLLLINDWWKQRMECSNILLVWHTRVWFFRMILSGLYIWILGSQWMELFRRCVLVGRGVSLGAGFGVLKAHARPSWRALSLSPSLLVVVSTCSKQALSYYSSVIPACLLPCSLPCWSWTRLL